MLREVLWVVSDSFEFQEEEINPDFVIFGPYQPPPPAGRYVRIGYFCENSRPKVETCDWAFGIPYEEEVRNDKYRRIEWHGIKPQDLVKEIPAALSRPIPPGFCNFVFSNRVAFRESFFRALCQYKHVDAPGGSMKNHSSLDSETGDDTRWVRKRRFLSQYKFTIAFESDSKSGYNTEKLTDPMLAGSVPIYFGNPEIGRHFNAGSFINAHDYLASRRHFVTRWVERLAQEESGGMERFAPRVGQRFRKAMRGLKLRLEYGRDFRRLVARIREVDQDDVLYRAIQAQPWVPGNMPPSVERVRQRWIDIFHSEVRPHAAAR